MEGKKSNFFVQAWLVLILALCYGAALAGVHMQLSPKIAQNKINETLEKVPELVLGDAPAAQREALQSEKILISVNESGRQTFYNVFKATRNGEVEGWVAKASAQGYADTVEVLIGLSREARTITGLFVLSQKETPGLGAKITERQWRRQFVGKPTSTRLEVVKDGADETHEIDAITGATISSNCVKTIVNTTVADLKRQLAERLQKNTLPSKTPATKPTAE